VGATRSPAGGRAGPRASSRWWLWAGLALAGLALLGAVAGQPEVGGWEQGLFAAVNGLPQAVWPPFYLVMQAGTLAAGPVGALLALATGRRLLAGRLAAAGIAAWLLPRVAKILVGRPRPGLLLPSVIVRGDESGGLGYPSGHVSVAMALAVVLLLTLPGRWRWLSVLAVAGVAAGRMYAGAHLPLDIFGGVLLGALVGAAVCVVRRRRAAAPVA
jgi:glycosyltransferase 2 family protein